MRLRTLFPSVDRRGALRRLAMLLVPAAFVASAMIAPRPARAIVVEKVVAIIGDEAILLSDLRARAAPFLRCLSKQNLEGPSRAAAESQLYKELLQKMQEDELERQAVLKNKVPTTAEDVDFSLKQVAAQQGMTPEQLIVFYREKQCMTEQDVRDEMRRQVIEGQLLNIRTRGRVRISEEDLKSAYARSLREERERRDYRPAWIAFRMPPGMTPEEEANRLALANDILKRARAGEDFGELALDYSEDGSTKERGGDLGIRATQKSAAAQAGKKPVLAPDLEKVVLALEPGEISEPVKAGDGIVIIKLLSRQKSRYTTYEAAKPEMMQRIKTELLLKERATMIDELKRRTHVDPRM
jgi:peptidyl-prolyl cis-trans isomerase SurA